MNEKIIFNAKIEFIQAAFNQVAKIVSDHGEQILECSVPALSTEQCLFHLSNVALAWSYDNSQIEAYAENYKIFNDEISEYFGE